jgi:hypothetical protein
LIPERRKGAKTVETIIYCLRRALSGACAPLLDKPTSPASASFAHLRGWQHNRRNVVQRCRVERIQSREKADERYAS